MPSRRSVRVISLATGLFGLMLCSGLLPQGSGPLGPFIISDLGLSPSQFGLLPASYYAGAIVLSLPGSLLIVRFGVDWVLIGSSFLQILALLAIGTHDFGYGVLLLLFFLSGLSAGGMNPAANGVISSARMGAWLMVGMRQSGIPAATFLGGAVLVPLSGLLGWRRTLAATSILVVVFLIVTALGRERRIVQPPVATRGSVRSRRERARVVWLLLFAMLMAMGQAPITQFAVVYLSSPSVNMSIGLAAGLFGVMGLLGWPARLFWASLYERPLSPQISLGISCGMSIVAVAMLMLVTRDTHALAVVALLLMGVFVVAWMVLANLSIVRHAPDRAEYLTGVLYTGFYLGLLVSTPTFGLIVELSGGYRAAWAYSLMCMLLGLAVLTTSRATLLGIKPAEGSGRGRRGKASGPTRS